jgi:flagellar motor protein MotB
MIDFCDASDLERDGRQFAARRQNASLWTRSLRRWGILATALLAGGCSWFGGDEPAFPPTAGGPDIATVPTGLGSDTANAEYTDQQLGIQAESAPRPVAPPPAPAKAAETAPADGSAPAAAAEPSKAAPAGTAGETAPTTTPTPAPTAESGKDKENKGYPDINSVPMVRPTPEPETEPTEPAKPGQSSQLRLPLDHQQADAADLMITTAAGGASSCDDATAAPIDLAQAVTQPVESEQSDVMFSKPVLPPYTSYEQMQKQAQSQSQSLYRSPYAAPASIAGPAVELGQPAVAGQSVGQSAGQTYINEPTEIQANGQPIGLVYFNDGSVKLSGEDARVLRQIAKLQQTYGGVIRVVGHASSRTENMPLDRHFKTNADISQARANAVARYLAHLGVDPNYLQVAAVSDSRPVYPEFMPVGEAANRRAEIYLSSY